jgi:hypothetical protein
MNNVAFSADLLNAWKAHEIPYRAKVRLDIFLFPGDGLKSSWSKKTLAKNTQLRFSVAMLATNLPFCV